MWKDSVPPRKLSASTYQTGYWTPVRSYDTIHMEALIFGTSDTELSKITGFSSDRARTSFIIHYEDGSSRYIGRKVPGTENTMFNIDGQGGERITKVEIGMNSLAMGIKVSRGAHPLNSRYEY